MPCGQAPALPSPRQSAACFAPPPPPTHTHTNPKPTCLRHAADCLRPASAERAAVGIANQTTAAVEGSPAGPISTPSSRVAQVSARKRGASCLGLLLSHSGAGRGLLVLEWPSTGSMPWSGLKQPSRRSAGFSAPVAPQQAVAAARAVQCATASCRPARRCRPRSSWPCAASARFPPAAGPAWRRWLADGGPSREDRAHRRPQAPRGGCRPAGASSRDSRCAVLHRLLVVARCTPAWCARPLRTIMR